MLMERQPQLKTVIDLTNTFRYYNGQEEFGTKGIDHVKIMVEGLRDRMPTVSKLQEFFDAMDRHMEKYRDTTDALIGIHCTHGLNRTGYFVCKWMLERMKITPDDAIQRFNSARGHTIERKHLLNDLRINSPLSMPPSNPISPPFRKTNEYRSPLDDSIYDEPSRDSRYSRYRGRDMSDRRGDLDQDGSSRREQPYGGRSDGGRSSRNEHSYRRGPDEPRRGDRELPYETTSDRYRGNRDISGNYRSGRDVSDGNSNPRTYQRHPDSDRRDSTAKRADGSRRADVDTNWRSRGSEENTRGAEQRDFRNFGGEGRRKRNDSDRNRSHPKLN